MTEKTAGKAIKLHLLNKKQRYTAYIHIHSKNKRTKKFLSILHLLINQIVLAILSKCISSNI